MCSLCITSITNINASSLAGGHIQGSYLRTHKGVVGSEKKRFWDALLLKCVG